MRLVIRPGKPLHGQMNLPGDKSMSHRAALFAALAQGRSVVRNFLDAGVTRAMLEALEALGVKWTLDGDWLTVDGRGLEGLVPPQRAIHCSHSATTMRLLTGALAAAGIPATLDGSASLRRRPMRRIVEPLRAMGVPIEADGGNPPLHLYARSKPLMPLDFVLPVASAQVKSCLLLAGFAADGTSRLCEPERSRDHTERLLAGMGIAIKQRKLVPPRVEKPGRTCCYLVELTPPTPLRLDPLDVTLPGDFSAAAFLIAAVLITPGSKVVLQGCGLNPTRTGFLDTVREMGATAVPSSQDERSGEPVGNLDISASSLQGVNVSGERVVRMIDEFPILAVLAAFAQGETVVSDARELRFKEANRISTLCAGLRSLGARVREMEDGFEITGDGGLDGGIVDAAGDHRLAMAFTVAGLAARRPVVVQGAEIISESFPEFVPSLRSLGADIRIERES